MIERNLERGIFASRWIMAPFFVGLILALVVLLVKFVQELAHMLPGVPRMTILASAESSARVSATAAPAPAVAIRLCPQAWPISGSASYSAQIAIVVGP